MGRVGSKQGTMCLSGSSGRLTGKDGLLPFNLTIPCIRDADDDKSLHRVYWGERNSINIGLKKQKLLDCVMGRGLSAMLFMHGVQVFCRHPMGVYNTCCALVACRATCRWAHSSTAKLLTYSHLPLTCYELSH